MSPYQTLIDALNNLAAENGVEVLSINFSRSDVPIEWDDDKREWYLEERDTRERVC